MKNRNLLKMLSLVLLIILIGSFSFAEDKKAVSPGQTSPQQGCTDCDKKTSNPDISNVSPTTSQENKAADPKSLVPPPIQKESSGGG